MTAALKTPPLVFPQTDLERIRDYKPQDIDAEKVRLQKATREFEAFFLHYMLKNMRRTIPKDPLTDEAGLDGSLGKDIFTDLFDMEVARRITRSDGRSIAAMLYKSVESRLDMKSSPSEPEQLLKPIIEPGLRKIEIDRDVPLLPTEQNRFIEQPRPAVSLPVVVPRAGIVDPILTRYGRYIDEAAEETKLDSALIASVIKVESNGNPNAVSSAGAKGLMQLGDSTAKELGVEDPFDPVANIRAGSRYLRRLLDRFGDLRLALAAYNAGPGLVEKYDGVPPYRETRAYVTRVCSFFKEAVASSNRSTPKVGRDVSR